LLLGWLVHQDSLNTIWAQRLGDELKRHFYKNWYKIKKKSFSKYTKKYETDEGKKDLESDLERMKKYATVVHVLAHTQVQKQKGIKQKKAHLMEIQSMVAPLLRRLIMATIFLRRQFQ
jgi:large subunit ribosomal protein L3e